MLDRLDETSHRRPREDEGRDFLHRLFDGADRPSHRCELVGLFDPAELVHERRPGPQPVEADGAAEVQDGLRPHAVADRDGALYPEPADDALERSVASSVSETTTTSPCGSPRWSNATNIRGSTNTGSSPGLKNAPATQWWA